MGHIACCRGESDTVRLINRSRANKTQRLLTRPHIEDDLATATLSLRISVSHMAYLFKSSGSESDITMLDMCKACLGSITVTVCIMTYHPLAKYHKSIL
eukprot:7946922-Karenia_brevis.AAC.1